ncbi:MAG: HAD family hydrolase [Clostridiales bacterium]|nr:HAD family hydrolase [Clostridiales bacterium]
MTKMIVLDLDETLLRSDKTISSYTETVLQKAREAGIKLVLATGRPKRSSAPYYHRLQCDALICHNGNIILYGEQCISGPGVPIREAKRILTFLQKKYPDKKLSVEIDDRIYANFDVSVIWGKTEEGKQMLGSPAIVADFSCLTGESADKILIELDSEEEYREVQNLLTPDLYAQSANGGKLCVVMNKSTSKLNAIKQLAELWDISVSRITAFGDDYNDIEMLCGCGTGVSMANAIPDVKEAADVVTGTNNDDGVAEYIMNRILSNK